MKNGKIISFNEKAAFFGCKNGDHEYNFKRNIKKNQILSLEFNEDNYKDYSKRFFEELKIFDKNMEIKGMHEANLNMTYYLSGNMINSQKEIKFFFESLRKKISQKLNLDVNCGVSITKELSKICSDEIYNDLFYLSNTEEEIKNYIADLPLKRIPGLNIIFINIL